MDLNDALKQFDAVETNLARLDKVMESYEALIPAGISFTAGSPEGLRADELQEVFRDLVASLPPIDGWTIDAALLDLDDIAQSRLDAADIGEPQIEIDLSDRSASRRGRSPSTGAGSRSFAGPWFVIGRGSFSARPRRMRTSLGTCGPMLPIEVATSPRIASPGTR